jgi:hypothetical protein
VCASWETHDSAGRIRVQSADSSILPKP